MSFDEKLIAKIQQVEKGGAQKYHQKNAEAGKLFARERIRQLMDPDSFVEDAKLANNLDPELPSDGVITGVGKIHGRHVAVMANDSTIKAGGPAVILSASGMATGGRILHHLAQRLPQERNTVLFVGYQSAGTRGWRLLRGEQEVRIHGQMVPVRAEIRSISGFSAHADWEEMMRWMDGFEAAPALTLLVHGEPSALSAQQQHVNERGWKTHVPAYLERVELPRA